MSEQLNRIESLLVSFIEKTDQRFELIDKRFDSIDQRFDSIDLRFESVDQRFDSIQEQLNRIEQSQNDDTVTILKQINTKVSDIKHTAEYTLKEQSLIKLDIDKIKNKLPSIHSPNTSSILDRI